MATLVNAGGRLDRLPICSFHHRIFWLVGAGMLLDGYDLYVFTNVLPAAAQSGFSTALQNADFISKTFLGMTIGALVTGFLGDRYGRRFTYQINLLIFGAASLAAAFAPDMTALIWLRFIMGLGLGAEIVVGYSTLTEFVPPKSRPSTTGESATKNLSRGRRGPPCPILLGQYPNYQAGHKTAGQLRPERRVGRTSIRAAAGLARMAGRWMSSQTQGTRRRSCSALRPGPGRADTGHGADADGGADTA